MVHYEVDYAITHALAYTDGVLLPDATIVVEQGFVRYVGKLEQEMVQHLKKYDAKGSLVGPGLVDMHIHGCGGFDSTRSNIQENLEGMALFLAEKGITSFQLAVVMDLDLLDQIKQAMDRSAFLSSHLLGVYVEGPFIAPEKKGGIPSSGIRTFDRGYLEKILSIKCGKKPLVTSMTIAPELQGSEELSNMLERNNIVVAYGHSDCPLDALHPRDKNHLTHLFNAMSGIDHKRPGLAAMPFVRNFSHATYELVCDEVHVHPSVIDLTINSLGTERLCLISDAMSLAGMGAGEGLYLGKQMYSNGKACYYRDSDILIGSAMLISESAQNLFHKNLLDKQSFFQVASENPLRVLSQTDRGCIKPGYKADLVMLSSDMEIQEVFKVV
ncbi:MAG: amidohydrolase family protein [Sphaerochaeta associata]|uniref:amidohydrolase family protein n=1 Tax=Sphaerochaeta associata TaxID=1129264 RepID=UPI002B212BC7|nr:amidohydrolase family protein [Sphaerochaeta associata]MEA5029537.1 amidohydrolase family protein [Sphaerochaeta associata]